MSTTIVAISTGFTSSAIHCPIVWATTACGHGARVALRPSVLRCTGCGVTQTIDTYGGQRTERCTCGDWSHTFDFTPDPHNPEHWLTVVDASLGTERLNCRAFQSPPLVSEEMKQLLAEDPELAERLRRMEDEMAASRKRLEAEEPETAALLQRTEDEIAASRRPK